MKFQVLVSTMNQVNTQLINEMNIQSDAIIINQNTHNSINKISKDSNSILWINSNERGLSKSRNTAIKNATADICLIADDDLIYVDNVKNLILEEFEKHPEADIIAFQVDGINEIFKRYSTHFKKLNIFSIMRVSSVEIAFKLSSIREKNIKFNEKFGSGAKYVSGEENLFLKDALDAKLNVFYAPIKIANVFIGDSTWFSGFNDEYFVTKGAMFATFFSSLSLLLILQFAIRKRKKYYQEMTMRNAIKAMMKGRKEVLKLNDVNSRVKI